MRWATRAPGAQRGGEAGGASYTLCKSTDAATCNGSADWEDGWIVFSDINGNGTPDIGTGACAAGEDCVLRAQGTLAGANTLRADANFSSLIAYLPNGVSRGNGGLAAGTFRLCDARGQGYARSIAIGTTGRPKVSESASACP